LRGVSSKQADVTLSYATTTQSSSRNDKGVIHMTHRLPAILICACVIGSTPAFAQVLPQIPNLENRIPSPLPPPAPPPVVNGPLSQGAASPTISQPPRLDTFGDRTAGCIEQGGTAGLRGGALDRYTRDCANDH
jgi:hypothetical protein